MIFFPFLGTGCTRANFQEEGNLPCLYDIVKRRTWIGVSSGAHFLRTIADTPSGPTALLQSSLVRIRLMVRWRKVISGIDVLVFGTDGGAFPCESKVELAANSRANISAFSLAVTAVAPSSAVRGGKDVLKFLPTAFANDQKDFDPVGQLMSLSLIRWSYASLALLIEVLHKFLASMYLARFSDDECLHQTRYAEFLAETARKHCLLNHGLSLGGRLTELGIKVCMPGEITSVTASVQTDTSVVIKQASDHGNEERKFLKSSQLAEL